MNASDRDIRDLILEKVEEGLIDKDYLILAMLNYMSQDEVADMAQANELIDESEEETEEIESLLDEGMSPEEIAEYLPMPIARVMEVAREIYREEECA